MKRFALLAVMVISAGTLAGCFPATSRTVYPVLNFSGTGDQVLNLALPAKEVVFAHITGGDANSNFAIWTDDANNNHIDLLVNTTDVYTGNVPVNFANAPVARIEVHSSGPSQWTISLQAIATARHEPGSFQGTGDDVVITPVSPPSVYHITGGAANTNFAVWSYNAATNPVDLLVNTTDPYDGVVAVPPYHYIVVVTATGPWSFALG
jgi:hypothetical protein